MGNSGGKQRADQYGFENGVHFGSPGGWLGISKETI
jgi:hypothetical protein